MDALARREQRLAVSGEEAGGVERRVGRQEHLVGAVLGQDGDDVVAVVGGGLDAGDQGAERSAEPRCYFSPGVERAERGSGGLAAR